MMHHHHAVSSWTLDPDPRYITPFSTCPFPSFKDVLSWLINSINIPWGYVRPTIGMGLECNDPIDVEFAFELGRRDGISDGLFKR
jgi:hypothetical protein